MNKKPIFALLLAGLLVPASLFAYGWPSIDPVVRKTFAQYDAHDFLAGVELESTQREIRSPNNGEVVFQFNPADLRTQRLPSMLGGFVLLNHEANLRTLVSNIQFPSKVDKTAYQKGEIIGSLNFNEGKSSGLLRLFVFDQQNNEIVNPFLILPPPVDGKAPVVVDVEVESDNGTKVSLFQKSAVPLGEWTILLTAGDLEGPRGAEFLRNVHSIQGYLNGQDFININLDSLVEKAGRWQVKGMTRNLSDYLIGDKLWNLGKVFLVEGTNILELVVRDFAGNQTDRTFRVRGVRN